MWLYAYEAVTQGFLPGVNDGFIVADPYFSLLRAKRVQFLDIERGYASIASTLRNLRNGNDRLRRLREAIEEQRARSMHEGSDDDVFDDLDDLDDDAAGDEDSEVGDIY